MIHALNMPRFTWLIPLGKKYLSRFWNQYTNQASVIGSWDLWPFNLYWLSLTGIDGHLGFIQNVFNITWWLFSALCACRESSIFAISNVPDSLLTLHLNLLRPGCHLITRTAGKLLNVRGGRGHFTVHNPWSFSALWWVVDWVVYRFSFFVWKISSHCRLIYGLVVSRHLQVYMETCSSYSLMTVWCPTNGKLHFS